MSADNSRKWYDSAKIVGVLAFVLYGCVMAWAATVHNQIGGMEQRLRSVEIENAAMRSDVKAIRLQLDRIESHITKP